MTKTILILAAVLISLPLGVWWFQRPGRTTQAFAGHLFHKQYEEAAKMLRAPSSLTVAPDGGLVLVDQTGRSTSVAASKLPFKVGGEPSAEFPSDFRMMALGSRTNGALDTPAVTLHFRVDGGEVDLVAVDT